MRIGFYLCGVWASMAHKLELAVKDAFKKTYIDTVVDTLTKIYYFYKGSAKRNKEVTEKAEAMEDHFLKPDKANGTRWVEHKLRAIAKMAKNWELIYICIFQTTLRISQILK